MIENTKTDRTVESLQILQINTTDKYGGAAEIAWNLFKAYQELGHHSHLAVGYRRSIDPEVIQIPNIGSNPWTDFWLKASASSKKFSRTSSVAGYLEKLLRMIGDPRLFVEYLNGWEDFEYPGTSHILEIIKTKQNIIHCHNLHGSYFDLREISNLCINTPLVLTLHDAWMLSGHCAHSFGCDLWKQGCGNCPDLNIYPALRQDATAFNWQRKREIYLQSHLYVTTPCQWLMDKVMQSTLAPAIIESRVIPNGVNLKVFKTYDQMAARAELGLPKKAKIILFAADGIRKNIWKDYETMQAAVSKVAKSLNRSDLIFIALGESVRKIKIGQVELRFIPYQKDPLIVSRYYQAADAYIHAARVDTFPNTILEALACGTPVVATSVGGIPEQIEHGKTGFLTLPTDANDMALRIKQLLTDRDMAEEMGGQAAKSARSRFDLVQQAEEYINWYKKILAQRKG